MKTKMTIALAATLGALALAASAQDNSQPAGDPPPSGSPNATQPAGGPGGRGGFHLLPPPLVQQLKLTDDQKTQIAALEADTKARLEKILTADQLTQLKNFRPPGRLGGQMRGGPGGSQGRNTGGNGPGGDENNMPPGPPPGEDGGNNPPSGPPPGGN